MKDERFEAGRNALTLPSPGGRGDMQAHSPLPASPRPLPITGEKKWPNDGFLLGSSRLLLRSYSTKLMKTEGRS